MANRTVLNVDGAEITQSTLIPFANPRADTLIAGPNVDFLLAIRKAFKLDANYVRYGTQIEGRTYKRMIFFVYQFPNKRQQEDLIHWMAYVKTFQEPKDELEVHIL